MKKPEYIPKAATPPAACTASTAKPGCSASRITHAPATNAELSAHANKSTKAARTTTAEGEGRGDSTNSLVGSLNSDPELAIYLQPERRRSKPITAIATPPAIAEGNGTADVAAAMLNS